MSEDGGTEGLSREVKQQIKRWVLELRHMFEGDFARQLRRFGIEADGEFVPVEELDYLDDDELRRREVIEATIRREAENEQNLAGGVEAYVRDAAYTYINRLVGLKCMEAREILFIDGEATEVITTRPEYGGRSRVLWRMRDADPNYREATAEERLWRDGLTRAFEAVTEEIKLLFDPDHEFSQLFPSHAVLMDAIELINEQFTLGTYAYPDFLGWVYQFFNVEEKEQIRAETRGKPRTSHELAVINQFYTPEWIVKFLVDNTLGRIWLQMHPDTKLYWLNRIPAEHRDLPREEIPEEVRDAEIFRGTNIDYLVPDTGEDQPIDLKPVGEVTLLDPACGTMHFGQYAYALYYQMYLEELEHAGEDGWPRQPSVPGPEAIPNAILERNLHGIDIDERAIQIAALTLMLTMKEQAKAHGLDPRDVHVRDMNLVVADAVNLGEEEMETFLQRLDPTIFGGEKPMRNAVQAIWDSLEHVAELGSLIQPGEGVERALTQPLDETAVQLSFGGSDRTEILEITERLDADSVENARDYLLMMLQEFAAENGASDITQRLFAKETEKGLQLLRLTSGVYDAVLMNPPYGQLPQDVKEHARNVYDRADSDIYSMFIASAIRFAERNAGFVGAITSRTFLQLKTFRRTRSNLLMRSAPPRVLVDLGYEVLDGATVATSAFVLGSSCESPACCRFLRLVDDQPDVREAKFQSSLREDTSFLKRDMGIFEKVPYNALIYWVPPAVLELFDAYPPLSEITEACGQGVATANAARFERNWWEVAAGDNLVPGWKFMVKGGGFERYYAEPDLAIQWRGDGRAVKDYGGSVVRNEDLYFQEGLTWTKKPNPNKTYIACRRLPGDVIFSVEGPACFPNVDLDGLNALLCSRLVFYLAHIRSSGHNVEVGTIETLPVVARAFKHTKLQGATKSIRRMKRFWNQGNEIARVFALPWLLFGDIDEPMHDAPTALVAELQQLAVQQSLSALLASALQAEEQWSAECQRLQDEIDEIVYDLYDISAEDRELIERELGDRPKETVWPEMEGKSREEKRLEHVERLLSYFVKTIVEEDADGIVPLVQCGDEPTMLQRVREKLDETFGADRGHEIEVEISNELGARTDVESWLARRYFRFHINLYKRRPIFWHISSADRSFGAIVHYHRFDHDALLKLRAHYLSSFMQRLKTEMGRLRGSDDSDARKRLMELEESLEAAQELDRKLGQIAEGDPYAIEVPWKDDDEQPRGWRPDLDDGVKVNIQPFIEADVFPFKVRI